MPIDPHASPKEVVKQVMHEWKGGSLHSGSEKGPVVKDQRQAVAIALHQSGLSKSGKKKHSRKEFCEKCGKRREIEHSKEAVKCSTCGNTITSPPMPEKQGQYDSPFLHPHTQNKMTYKAHHD